MTGIRWESISLEGFGPYANKTKVNLIQGLNLFAAPNETGKSTLVEGLRAVIFGLPNSKDPKGFTTARFRSWSGAENFEGEVNFIVNGTRYRIKRQFEKHRVIVAKEEKGQWITELETEHNPSATKGAGDYQNYLGNLLGLTNDKIFIDTFYLTQPLPELGSFSGELKALLSGSGGNFSDALRKLEDELGRLTRYVKDRGFPRNKNTDRVLEELEAQIINLENQLRDSQVQVDQLQTVLGEISQLAIDLKENKEKYQSKKRLQEAWGKGRQLHRRYEELLAMQTNLAGSKEQLQDLTKAMNRTGEEIKVTHNSFLEVEIDFAEVLEQLLKWEGEISRLKGELGNLEKELKEHKDVIAKINAKLADFKQFKNNPHLSANVKELKGLEEIRITEIEQKTLLLQKLKSARLQEESRERKNKILLNRLVFVLSVAVGVSIAWWSVGGIWGALIGLPVGGFLGWGLSYLILGGNKKALALPETNEALDEISRQDIDFGEGIRKANAKELEALLICLELLLKRDESQETIVQVNDLIKATSIEQKVLTPLIKRKKESEDLIKKVAPYDFGTTLECVEKDYNDYLDLSKELSITETLIGQLEKRIKDTVSEQEAYAVKCKEARGKYQLFSENQFSELKKVKESWAAFQNLNRKHQEQIREYEGLLKGVQVKSQKELELNYLEIQNKVIGLQRDLEDLEKNHPGLPPLVGSKNLEREGLEEAHQKLEDEVKTLQWENEKLLEKQQELKLKQVELEGKGLINIAQGELELKELKEKRESILFEIDALEIAYKELKEAIAGYNHSYRERLAEQITFYFRKFTDSDRTIIISENFEVRVLVEGQEREVHQFSQGARDQLFFALRLAVGDLLAENFQLPFMLDDPFLNYDQNRLEEVKKLLIFLAEERQIFFLTHRDELEAWGNRVVIEKE